MFEKMQTMLTKIKQEKPLILNMTNDVTMDMIANGLLSLGASPMMSKSPQEMADLMQLAHAVVINVGTLDETFVALCEQACTIANQLKKPIILDPVGAGASRYRTATCLQLIKNYDFAIIRGNASEVLSLSDECSVTRGVENNTQSDAAIKSAQMISTRHDVVIMISGKTDIIIDGTVIHRFDRGSSLMPMITGTGCLLSAVIAAFHAVEKNRVEASAAAAIFYGMCGEIAEEKTKSPASFKIKFIDALNAMPTRGQYEKR